MFVIVPPIISFLFYIQSLDSPMGRGMVVRGRGGDVLMAALLCVLAKKTMLVRNVKCLS